MCIYKGPDVRIEGWEGRHGSGMVDMVVAVGGRGGGGSVDGGGVGGGVEICIDEVGTDKNDASADVPPKFVLIKNLP